MAGVPPFEAEGDTQSIVASEGNAQHNFTEPRCLCNSGTAFNPPTFYFLKTYSWTNKIRNATIHKTK